MIVRRLIAVALGATAALVSPLRSQAPSQLAQERSAYAEWLATAPNSPLAAIAVQPIGQGVSLGPADAEIPLDGVASHRVTERSGTVTLEGPDGSRPLPGSRPIPLGRYTLSVGGLQGRKTVTVFGPEHRDKRAEYYGYDPKAVFVGPMAPAERSATVRLLALDGVETEATEAGSVTIRIGGRPIRLQVRRIPTGVEDEAELEIFFRDSTNAKGTYPAGRFVSLEPLGDGRYRLDFNRSRNPFCAYNSVFPCPAPWRGNTVPAAIEAGERYLGGGLTVPPETGTR